MYFGQVGNLDICRNDAGVFHYYISAHNNKEKQNFSPLRCFFDITIILVWFFKNKQTKRKQQTEEKLWKPITNFSSVRAIHIMRESSIC